MPIFEVHPDIAQARTLATDPYTSPQHFETAMERIFAPSWQDVDHVDELTEDRSARPLTLLENYLDEPLVLVRDSGARGRFLANVCTHRGNILVNSPWRVNKLRCRYHGRQFQLDGRFASMPEFSGAMDFP